MEIPADITSQIAFVVDDDQFFVQLVRDILEQHDICVLGANSGSEALQQLQKLKPDIILLDLELPDMHGFQIAEQLSQNEIYKNIPIVITSADETEYAIDHAYEYNVYAYIVKPIIPSLLIKQVKTTLHHHRLRNELLKKEIHISQLQQLGGMGTWEYRLDSNEFICSDDFFSVLDVSPKYNSLNFDEFLGYAAEEVRDELKNLIFAAIHGGKSFSIEHTMINEYGMETLILHHVYCYRKINSDNYAVSGAILDITERRNQQNLITYTRFYDKVTSLPNRENFCNRLGTLMQQTEKDEKLLAIMFVGIDRFQGINETFGRSVGDDVLVKITAQLKSYDNTEVYRYSGDIFAVILKDMRTIVPAEDLAEDIILSLAKPMQCFKNEIYISVSIGMAIYPMIQGDKDELINSAESAMYQAKRHGGNRLVCFDKLAFTRGMRRLNIETDLRKALDKQEFEVYYQPQVSVDTQKLIGMEALVRWNHPIHGIVEPNTFISIAESTGMIVPLGNWVLETATKQIKNWYDQGFGLFRVGINISPVQFESKSLVKDVADAIQKIGVLPCSIDLEITESSAMREITQTINILNNFKELGVQCSLDDFGTGYSSLSYLKQIPLNTIKIDRAFIKDISRDGKNGELAEIIIAMCQALNLNVIAEGVETEYHLHFLRKHRCIEAQGYFFSPPVPCHEFEELFQSYHNLSYNFPTS